MNKKEICEILQKYINGIDTFIDLEVPENVDKLVDFYYRTAKRLKNSFDVYRKNDCYRNDFLIALRDFLLVFEMGLTIEGINIPDHNDYAIKKNDTTSEYYCTFQFPEGVIAGFAESAFMRNVSSERVEIKDCNLMTDSLIYKITGFKYFKTMSQKLAVYGALNTQIGRASCRERV